MTETKQVHLDFIRAWSRLYSKKDLLKYIKEIPDKELIVLFLPRLNGTSDIVIRHKSIGGK